MSHRPFTDRGLFTDSRVLSPVEKGEKTMEACLHGGLVPEAAGDDGQMLRCRGAPLRVECAERLHIKWETGLEGRSTCKRCEDSSRYESITCILRSYDHQATDP